MYSRDGSHVAKAQQRCRFPGHAVLCLIHAMTASGPSSPSGLSGPDCMDALANLRLGIVFWPGHVNLAHSTLPWPYRPAHLVGPCDPCGPHAAWLMPTTWLQSLLAAPCVTYTGRPVVLAWQ